MLTCLTSHTTFVPSLVVLGLFTGVMPGGTSRFSSNSAAASSQVDRFAGHYVLIRDQSEDLKQAINRATETMNFVLRPIARRQLRQRVALYPSFAMGRRGDSFRTSLVGQTTLSLPLSGLPVLWRAPFGEVVRARLRPGPELLEIFETKRGQCVHLFRLSPDSRELIVDVKITSHDLPKPVEYRLVYRRA